VLTLIGLAVGLAAPRVSLGSAPTTPGHSAVASLWPGVGLQLYLGGLLSAVLLGSAGMRRWMGTARVSLRRVTATATVAVLAIVVVTTATLAARRGLGSGIEVGRDGLPAVALDQVSGPASSRVLLVTPSNALIDYQLVGVEPGDLLRDVTRPQEVTDPGVRAAVTALVQGPASGTAVDPGSAPALGGALAAQAIGFVVVRGGQPALLRRLDATAGLARLGNSDGQVLWRVLPTVGAAGEVEPSRVRLVDARGMATAAVPVIGPHGAVRHDLPAGPAARTVVFAEPPQWAGHATVTFAGAPLAPLTPARGTANPAYILPAGAGELVAALDPEQPRWRLAQGILLLVVVFLAVPFGTRRSRRRS